MADTKNRTWKSSLLSSGTPLEFQAAKVLVAKGFSVSFDYPYLQRDGETDKEFSVDIDARSTTPFSNENKVTASVQLLVECKYRHENMVWLFYPDINRTNFGPIFPGGSIRILDQFSPYFLEISSVVRFDLELKGCIKGVEMNRDKGDVFDREIRHGVRQMMFGMPFLVQHAIHQNIRSHTDDNVPYLFAPILLTTAPLYVLNHRCTIDEIKNAEEFTDIARRAPYLLLHNDIGPEFVSHARRQFRPLESIRKHANLEYLLERKRKSPHFQEWRDDPLRTRDELINYDGYLNPFPFSYFLVCCFDQFETLLDRIKAVISQTARSRKPL